MARVLGRCREASRKGAGNLARWLPHAGGLKQKSGCSVDALVGVLASAERLLDSTCQLRTDLREGPSGRVASHRRLPALHRSLPHDVIDASPSRGFMPRDIPMILPCLAHDYHYSITSPTRVIPWREGENVATGLVGGGHRHWPRAASTWTELRGAEPATARKECLVEPTFRPPREPSEDGGALESPRDELQLVPQANLKSDLRLPGGVRAGTALSGPARLVEQLVPLGPLVSGIAGCTAGGAIWAGSGSWPPGVAVMGATLTLVFFFGTRRSRS